MPKEFPRPAHEFTINTLGWERDMERNYRQAGFAPISDEIIVRRFWQFLKFMQDHGLTTRVVAESVDDLPDNIALRNSDLTDEGYYFIRRYHGRWLNRTRKDRGEEKENGFLTKWYDQFLLQKEG